MTTLGVVQEMCAENYWPEKGASLSCGIIQADLISETAFSFYTDRRISVSNKVYVHLPHAFKNKECLFNNITFSIYI